MNPEKLNTSGESSTENTSANEWGSLEEFGRRLAAEKRMKQNRNRSRLAATAEKNAEDHELVQSKKKKIEQSQSRLWLATAAARNDGERRLRSERDRSSAHRRRVR